jgi:UDP-glucose 4-epimerase
VQATLLACDAPAASGKVVNVGTGERISLNRTLELLREISGNALEAKYEPAREGDIRDSQADITLSRELLGYDPTVNFAEGLRRTFTWYQESQAKALAKAKTEN